MGLCCLKNPGFEEPPAYTALSFSGSEGIDMIEQEINLLKVIGRGKYGKVFLAKQRDNDEFVALKCIRKSENLHHDPQVEKSILEMLDSPFIVKLKFSFETSQKIYLALEYMAGGELYYHMRQGDLFSEYKARFYIAEVVLAMEYLHSKGIVYRDLKPENILIGLDGHIKLSDFSLSKIMDKESTQSFCGTAQYLAPEIIRKQEYDYRVDFWSLGVVLYELVFRKSPFYDIDNATMFKNVLEKPPRVSMRVSKSCSDLIHRLLEKDPNNRLSNFQEIKAHPFFRSFRWVQLSQKNVKPPFKPPKSFGVDVINFDAEFTSELPIDSADITIKEEYEHEFEENTTSK